MQTLAQQISSFFAKNQRWRLTVKNSCARSPKTSTVFMADLGGPSTPESGHSVGGGGVKEQDRFLPIANIGRIMKKAIPENGKIAKEAKESVQECVSEFISFITSEASDKCQREKRKTINGGDLLWAMGNLGFEGYVDTLKLYLSIYREMEGDPRGPRSTGEERGSI